MRPACDGLGERMLVHGGEAGGHRAREPFVEGGEVLHACDGGLALRERAGLVEADVDELARLLKIESALDEQAAARGVASAETTVTGVEMHEARRGRR